MSLFDNVVARNPCCRKYGQRQQMFGTDDILPLWIADMDFKTPDPILNNLISVATQPVQGYNMDFPGWKKSVVEWYRKQYGTHLREEWIHFIPGVIKPWSYHTGTERTRGQYSDMYSDIRSLPKPCPWLWPEINPVTSA